MNAVRLLYHRPEDDGNDLRNTIIELPGHHGQLLIIRRLTPTDKEPEKLVFKLFRLLFLARQITADIGFFMIT